MEFLPYQIFSPDGRLVLQAAENCRHSRRTEGLLLEAGYTIKLHGKRITKAEIRKAVKNGV